MRMVEERAGARRKNRKHMQESEGKRRRRRRKRQCECTRRTGPKYRISTRIHGVVMKTQVAQDGRWSKLHATTHEVLVGAGDAVQAFDALDDDRHGVWQG
jgi:hypothetical protein